MFSMPKRRSSWAFSSLVLFDHLALVQRPLDGHLQFFVDQRLGEEVEGAQADRLDRRFDRAVAGDHDDGRGGLLAAAMGQQFEAVAVAQADVDQHQVVALAVHGRGAPRQGWRPCRSGSPGRGASRPSRPGRADHRPPAGACQRCFMQITRERSRQRGVCPVFATRPYLRHGCAGSLTIGGRLPNSDDTDRGCRVK